MKHEGRSLTVLIIDDEAQIRRLLRISLEDEGYRVLEADNGRGGLAEAAKRRPDLVILDLGLPDMDGVQVLKRFREWTNVPILVLTVRDSEEDKIMALDNGADDYLTKPFGTGELLARLRVAQRHAEPTPDAPVFASGPLEVDLASRAVKVNGKLVRLTGIEFALLRLFVRHAGKVLTHDQIMKEVWSPAHVGRIHYLHIYMTHLRQKLEANPAEPKLLITEPRVGYRLAQT
jgi:two-component system, OmpR family, KDP operon response regulator KdpE